MLRVSSGYREYLFIRREEFTRVMKVFPLIHSSLLWFFSHPFKETNFISWIYNINIKVYWSVHTKKFYFLDTMVTKCKHWPRNHFAEILVILHAQGGVDFEKSSLWKTVNMYQSLPRKVYSRSAIVIFKFFGK